MQPVDIENSLIGLAGNDGKRSTYGLLSIYLIVKEEEEEEEKKCESDYFIRGGKLIGAWFHHPQYELLLIPTSCLAMEKY